MFIKISLTFKTKLFVRIAVPPSEVYKHNWKSSILGIINSQVLKKVDLIIAQTEFSKNDIAKHYNVPLYKIKVIRNIIDKTMLESKGNDCIPKEYSDENYNIVAAGALYSVKGFDLLIDAMVEVVKQKINTKLYILGDERYEEGYKLKLIDQIRKNKLEDNVFLLGHKSNPYPYYKNADLFVLSSRKEGFPNVVLEALYYGTPVVATDCVDFTSVITDGVNGYIVRKNSVTELSNGIFNAVNKLSKVSSNSIQNFNYEELFIV